MKTKYYINGISFYGVDWTCSSNPESKPLFGRILVEAMRQISHLRYKILHLNFPEASSTIIWSVIPTWNRYEEDKSITNIGNLPDLEAITNSPTYDQYLLDLRNAILQLLGYSNNPLFSKGFIRIGTENDKYPTRYSFRLIYNDIFNADRSTWCRNEITCKKLGVERYKQEICRTGNLQKIWELIKSELKKVEGKLETKIFFSQTFDF